MAFKKHKQIKIDIDTSTIAHDSPEVARRLERIESNYERFDELMVDLESRLPKEEKATQAPDHEENPAISKAPTSKAPRKPRWSGKTFTEYQTTFYAIPSMELALAQARSPCSKNARGQGEDFEFEKGKLL